MAEVVLFHHAQGLTPGLIAFADELRRAGHTVHTPDLKSMSFAFDLWSYDDVRAHAAGILDKLRDGSMPCDGAWPADRTEIFSRWTESGMQP